MQERFFSPGMDVGIGVNLLTGEALVQGVTGVVSPPDAGGQNVQSRIIRIDDMSTLHKSIGVDVSASGSYMGFSASAKMDYADSCGFNEHSIYLLVSVVVTNALARMDSPALTAEAVQLLQNGKPDRFRERFGDVFVAGIHTGGEYFAIFQITGTDESEKESLAAAVSASFSTIGANADLNVAINKAKESSHSHLDLRVFTFQNGGADTTQDQDPSQIMAKGHSFAPSLAGANARFAVPYSILPESYRSLNLPGDAANLIEIENQRETLATNFKVRNELMLLINNLDYILLSQTQNHNEFEPFDLTEWSGERNRLAAEFDSITSEAAACMRAAGSCHLAAFQAPSKPLPKRRAGLVTFDPTLDRDWIGAKSSPELGLGPGGPPIFIARGNMKLDLPHLFRIHKFSATVQINSIIAGGFPDLFVNLQRSAPDGSNPQSLTGDIRIPLALGLAEGSAFPSLDLQLVDNQLFRYFVSATFIVRNASPTDGLLVQGQAVVWQSFGIEFASG